MTTPTTEDRVKNVIADQVGIEAADVRNEQDLRSDLNLDSLDLAEIGMGLEEEFDLTGEVPDDRIQALTTVQSAIDLVNENPRATL